MSLKIGVQVYSVRESMAEDPRATLKGIAESGCSCVEFANDHAVRESGVGWDIRAEELKSLLDSLGLSAAGCAFYPDIIEKTLPDGKALSVFDEDYTKVKLDDLMRFQEKLGAHCLTMSRSFFSGREDVLRKCEKYNRVGERCKKKRI
jgi:sugar phosphate isomerase/epimerase